jgi:DNA repair protein RadC
MTDIISDMPIDDRPRERLLAHGPRTLSDAELLGILIGCGAAGKNAVQLARELLPGGIAQLATRQPTQLTRYRGMGTAKAARVAAAFELARRAAAEKPIEHPEFDVDLTGTALVSANIRQKQERLGAYFLDARNKIIVQREIFVGTVNQALISTRDILRLAVEENAVGVALYHNHPSGDPTPSGHDVEFTRRLHQALVAADIELVDHLITGKHSYLSMKRKGLY